MTAEMFKLLTGSEIVHIPFKRSGDSMPAMLSGQVDINFDNLQGSLALIQSGKYRVLGVASRNREALIPNVPSLIESGLPDFVVATWNAVWTTGGTPPDVVQRYENELRKILLVPEVVATIHKGEAGPPLQTLLSGLCLMGQRYYCGLILASRTNSWPRFIS